ALLATGAQPHQQQKGEDGHPGPGHDLCFFHGLMGMLAVSVAEAVTGVAGPLVSKPPPSARCRDMRLSMRAWRAVIWALRPSSARCWLSSTLRNGSMPCR